MALLDAALGPLFAAAATAPAEVAAEPGGSSRLPTPGPGRRRGRSGRRRASAASAGAATAASAAARLHAVHYAGDSDDGGGGDSGRAAAAAARHEFTQRGWARFRARSAAALRRPEQDLVFARSAAWREVQAKRELLGLLASADHETDANVAVETWAASLRNPLRDARFHAAATAAPVTGSSSAAGFSPVRYVRVGGPTSPLFAPLADPAARRARVFGGMTRGQLAGLRAQLLRDLHLLHDDCDDELGGACDGVGGGGGGAVVAPQPMAVAAGACAFVAAAAAEAARAAAARTCAAFPSLAASYRAGAASAADDARLQATGGPRASAPPPRAPEPHRSRGDLPLAGASDTSDLVRLEYAAHHERQLLRSAARRLRGAWTPGPAAACAASSSRELDCNVAERTQQAAAVARSVAAEEGEQREEERTAAVAAAPPPSGLGSSVTSHPAEELQAALAATPCTQAEALLTAMAQDATRAGCSHLHVQLLHDATLRAGDIGPAWVDGHRLPARQVWEPAASDSDARSVSASRGSSDARAPLAPSEESGSDCAVETGSVHATAVPPPWPVVVLPDAGSSASTHDGDLPSPRQALLRLANTGATMLYVRLRPQLPTGDGAGSAFTTSVAAVALLPGSTADVGLRFDSSCLPPPSTTSRSGFFSATWELHTMPALSGGVGVPTLGLRAFVPPAVAAAGGVTPRAAVQLEARLALAAARAREADKAQLAAAHAAAAAAADASSRVQRVREFVRANAGRLTFRQQAWDGLSCVAREALERGGGGGGSDGGRRAVPDAAAVHSAWGGSVARLQMLVDTLPLPPLPLAEGPPPPPSLQEAAAVSMSSPPERAPAMKGAAAPQALHPAAAKAGVGAVTLAAHYAPAPDGAADPDARASLLQPEVLSARDDALQWQQHASGRIARLVLECARERDNGIGRGGNIATQQQQQQQQQQPRNILGIVDVRLDGRIVLLESELASLPAPLLRAASCAAASLDQQPPCGSDLQDDDTCTLPIRALISTRRVQNALPTLRNALACGASAVVVPLHCLDLNSGGSSSNVAADDATTSIGAAPSRWLGLAAAISADLTDAHHVVALVVQREQQQQQQQQQQSAPRDEPHRCITIAAFVCGRTLHRAVTDGAGDVEPQQLQAYVQLLEPPPAGDDLARMIRGLAEGCRRRRLPAPIILLETPALPPVVASCTAPPSTWARAQISRHDEPRAWRPWQLALWLRHVSAYVTTGGGECLDSAPLPLAPAIDAVATHAHGGSVLLALVVQDEGTRAAERLFGLTDPVAQSALVQAATRLLLEHPPQPAVAPVASGDPASLRAAAGAVFRQAARSAALCNSVDVVVTDRFMPSRAHPPFILARARALALRLQPSLVAPAGGGAPSPLLPPAPPPRRRRWPPTSSSMATAASAWSLLRGGLGGEPPATPAAASNPDGGMAVSSSALTPTHAAAVLIGCVVRAFLARRRVARKRRERAARLAALCGPTGPAQWAGLQGSGLEAFGLPRPTRDRHRHLCRLPVKAPAWGCVVSGMSLLPPHVAAAVAALGQRLSAAPAAVTAAAYLSTPVGGSRELATAPTSSCSSQPSRPRMLVIIGGGGGGSGSLSTACVRARAYLRVADVIVLVGALGAAWVGGVTLPRLWAERRHRVAGQEAGTTPTPPPPLATPPSPESLVSTSAPLVLPAQSQPKLLQQKLPPKATGGAAAPAAAASVAPPPPIVDNNDAAASLAGLTRSVLGRTAELWSEGAEWDACGDALRELARDAAAMRVPVIAPLDFCMGAGPPLQTHTMPDGARCRWHPMAPTSAAGPALQLLQPKSVAMRTLFDAAAAAVDADVDAWSGAFPVEPALFTWARRSGEGTAAATPPGAAPALGSAPLLTVLSNVPQRLTESVVVVASAGARSDSVAGSVASSAPPLVVGGAVGAAAKPAALGPASALGGGSVQTAGTPTPAGKPPAAATGAAAAASKATAAAAPAAASSAVGSPAAVASPRQQPLALGEELYALDVGPRTVDNLRRVLCEFVAPPSLALQQRGAGARGAAIVLHGPAGVVELPGGQAGTRAVLSAVAASGRREGTGSALVGGALASFVYAHAAELVADGLTALSFDAVAPSSL